MPILRSLLNALRLIPNISQASLVLKTIFESLIYIELHLNSGMGLEKCT